MNPKNEAMHVSIVTMIVNIILSIFKILAGILANSAAMISDAVHSASDVISTIIVMIGIREANKSSDKKHPYGHERIEMVASMLLAMALFITGLIIGIDALKSILHKEYLITEPIGILALVAALTSIAVKEWMFHYTKHTAKKLNSTALMADAWHHRSDAISSVGALIGISLAMAGYPIFDPIAGIIICMLIVKVALDIFRESTERMIDTSADTKTETEIIEIINSVEGVLGINSLTTRLFGSKIYVDLEIFADGNLTLIKAHEIAQNVHDKLESRIPQIKHCMVHVDPAE